MSAVLLQRRRGCTDTDTDTDTDHANANNSPRNNCDNGYYGLEEGNSSGGSITDTRKSSKKLRNRWGKIWIKLSRFLLAATAAIVIVVVIYVTRKSRPLLSMIPVLPNLVDITGHVPSTKEWPLVHIVNTRFMQEQGPLETLGMARLKLFLTFCLPSMIKQSSQNFFWIIKTDPQFTTTSVFQLLIESVTPYQNIYIVASNNNFMFGSAGRQGSWRDGKEPLDLLQSKIYTGNFTKLRIAMALRNERPILETRLDADDGLYMHFIQYIQAVALKRFQPNGMVLGQKKEEEDTTIKEENKVVPQWLYWCSRRHIEWHSDTDPSLSEKYKENMGSVKIGYMNVIQHDKLCVTPGITIGYNVNTNNVPQYDHDKLYHNVRHSLACYDTTTTTTTTTIEDDNNNNENDGDTAVGEKKAEKGPCLELVEDFIFCAIRSRTWTSAGMYNIDLGDREVPRGIDQKKFIEKLWTLSKDRFGVNITKVMETQNFLIQEKKMIAYENLLGQCKSGHSCKDTAKAELKRLAEKEDDKKK
jgi:hypothetical protein